MIDADSHSFARTGRVMFTPAATRCEHIINKVKDVVETSTLHAIFDVVHNQGNNDVCVTEFCAALGGVMCRPLDYDTAMAMMNDTKCDTHVDYISLIRESHNLNKYKLRPTIRTYKKVVFLPGSNLYDTAVDHDLIHKAVNEGAVIKPHPITNWNALHHIQNTFGKQNVLNPKVSGWDLLVNAEDVFVASTSELFLYAIAHDKKISSIDIPTMLNTSYRIPFDYLQQHNWSADRMNDMFNSKLSGLFFADNYTEDDIKYYVAQLEKRYATSDNNSNT